MSEESGGGQQPPYQPPYQPPTEQRPYQQPTPYPEQSAQPYPQPNPQQSAPQSAPQYAPQYAPLPAQQYAPPYPQNYPALPAQPYAQPLVPVYPYAPWTRRAGAYLIDFAPSLIAQIPFWIGYVLYFAALLPLAGSTTTELPDLTAPLVWLGIGGVLLLAALGWQIYNRWIVAGRTGQSLGKRALKITLIAEATGQPIGALNAFLRDVLHVLDGIAYVGYLWPLWDEKRQTFSDKIMKTVVVDLRATPPHGAGAAAAAA